MNIYDSERMKNLFENDGYNKTELPNDADLIILNTCHIREKAAEKVYSDLGRLKKYKEKNKNLKIVVSGCVAQAEGKEIKKRSPLVDFIVGPQSYHKLPDMIRRDQEYLNDDFLQNEKFIES